MSWHVNSYVCMYVCKAVCCVQHIWMFMNMNICIHFGIYLNECCVTYLHVDVHTCMYLYMWLYNRMLPIRIVTASCVGRAIRVILGIQKCACVCLRACAGTTICTLIYSCKYIDTMHKIIFNTQQKCHVNWRYSEYNTSKAPMLMTVPFLSNQ